jgi:hypothetical protein
MAGVCQIVLGELFHLCGQLSERDGSYAASGARLSRFHPVAAAPGFGPGARVLAAASGRLSRTHAFTRPRVGQPGTGSVAEARAIVAPPAGLANRMRALASRHQLTLNAIVQGAWALLLSRYCSETDVVFGATVAGRPPELAGIESMLGAFINTVPIRAQCGSRRQPWCPG